MNSYITKYARIPYLTPPPPNPNIKTTTLQHEDTLKTFFEGIEYSFINDTKEKIQMLNNLEVNIPSICNLQSERLPKGAEPNKTSGTIMAFLTNLADNSYPLLKLCPLPKFDTLKLDFLINYCLNRRVTIERAVWAIHHYAIKMEISAETMTNTLTKINPPDPIFFCELCKGIYRKNLLNHTAFLKWSTINVQPENLMDYYKKDFVKTHSLLYYALSSQNTKGEPNFSYFYNLLKEDLCENQSQVIQFSILCENQKIFSLNEAKCLYQLILNNNLLERTRYIHQILISNEFKCDFSSYLQFMIPKIIFKDFPHYNFETILNSIRSASFFLNPSQRSKIALNICKTITNYFNDPINVSALAAWLIKKLSFQIEMDSFTQWIYELIEPTFSEESDPIENSKLLFTLKSLVYELQFQGIFNFKNFYDCIHYKRYFSTYPNTTKLIMSEFPILLIDLYKRFNIKDGSKKHRKSLNIENAEQCYPRILLDLQCFFPEKQIAAKLKKVKEDIFKNVELFKTLPFIIRFVICTMLICKNDKIDLENRLSSITLYNFLKEVGVFCLIPELTRKSDFAPINAKKFLAVYESHGLINEIKGIFDQDYSPSTPINSEQVSEFFISFSHMLSLHLLDLSFTLKTREELCFYFTLLFDDLLTFKNISYRVFFQFFTSFCSSKIIPDSLKMFVTVFLSSCYLQRRSFNRNYTKGSLNWDLNDIDSEVDKPRFTTTFSFASLFITDLFLQNILKPHEFITISFEILREQQENSQNEGEIIHLIESLFQIMFDFIETNQTFFESNDFLTEEIVDAFNAVVTFCDSNTSLKKSIESLYHNFLTQLRILKPPQFCTAPSQKFASALYTLLPTELFSDDFGSVISFFLKNLNSENLRFWCSWLRDYSEYKPGFPVVQHEPQPESKKIKYINELVDAFWRAKTTEKDLIDDQLLRECWWILCESRSISKHVLQRCISKSFFDFSFLHPALIYGDELILECLCDTLKETNSSAINDDFSVTASSAFIIFVSKYSDNYKYYSLIISIANRLLEWIMKLREVNSSMMMKFVDTFNFIICWSFDHSSEDESLNLPQGSSLSFKNFGNHGSFQDMLHEKIIPNLEKLPKELKRKIILNKPRQAFKIVPNPCYSDFVNQENESGNHFQIHSTFNEGGDSSYHNDFGFFDDVVDQLFWG